MARSIEQARRHIDRGELQAAEEITGRLRGQARDSAEVQFLEGCIRYKKGDFSGAVDRFRQVLERSPADVNARVNLGVALVDAGAAEAAIDHLRQALARRPDHFMAWYNLGNACRTLARDAEAREAYLRAIACRPDYHPAHNNLGLVSGRLGRVDEAEAAYRRAFELQPSPEAAINLLHLLKRHDAGRTHAFMHEAAARFDSPELLACIFPSAVNLCAWPLVARIRGRVLDYARSDGGKPGVLQDLLLPLNACPGIDPAGQLEIHRNWARRSGGSGSNPVAPMPAAGERRRVAYLSGDFSGHSVGLFMRHVLAAHDRGRFEILCYSTSGQKDALTREMARRVDAFADVSGLDDAALARRIRADGVHLLVDLGGHTLNTRVAVLRHRPAPVQVTYLGYPNTTGLEETDYRITDRYAESEDGTRYTERLMAMPESFLCFGSFAERPRPAEPPAVNKGQVTFGSFNHTRKLTPEAVRLWSGILKRVPGSRLLIKASLAGEACVQANLYEAFAAEGIARERVEMRGFTATRDSHLDSYNEVDIALDTFPYNGTTTTCEALWMGVPVVTLVGKVHAQRVSYSILKNIGVEETIARTEAEYAEIAVRLAQDLGALSALRARIPGAIRGSILCDPARFTHQLEDLYRALWNEKTGVAEARPARAGGWVDYVQDKPYIHGLLPSWQTYLEAQADTASWTLHQQAMDLYAEGRTDDVALRRVKLDRALGLMRRRLETRPDIGAAQTFLRIATELGTEQEALSVLEGRLERVMAGEAVELSEPFLPALAGYERIDPAGGPARWVLAQLLELRDRLLAGRMEYDGGDAPEVLDLIEGLGFRGDYVEARRTDLRARPGPGGDTPIVEGPNLPGPRRPG
ncbi:MAG: tetratricopeptide repeat protein [Gammaproteobacteria bacterium]|nr:tetratricopeptide repeat protein [Gammaproteobacteria bacterium]